LERSWLFGYAEQVGGVPVKRKKRAEAAGGPHTFRSPTALVVWWIWLLFAAANLVDLAVQGRDHTSLVAAAILVLATGVAYVTALRPRLLADDAGITVINPLRDHHIGWAGVTRIDLADLLRVRCDWSSQVGAAPGTKKYTKVITAWAVHYSRRRQLMAEARARRQSVRANRRMSSAEFGAGRRTGYAGSRVNPVGVSASEAEAERIVKILNEYVNAAHAEVVWAGGTAEIAGDSPPGQTTGHDVAEGPEASAGAENLRHSGWFEPLKSTWSWSAIAALVIPALILLVVCLV
jgi:Bacterial PH domain